VIFVLIGIVAGLGIATWDAFFHEKYYERDWAEVIFYYFMAPFMGGLLGMVVALFVGIAAPHHPQVDRQDLVALRDGTSVQGSFFLGSGQIDQQPVFYYYRKEGTGFKFDHQDADASTVFEDSQQPYMLIRTSVCNDRSWVWTACTKGSPSYEFHVPAGSVLRQVNLNLGKEK
jgi:hypothetical protein